MFKLPKNGILYLANCDFKTEEELDAFVKQHFDTSSGYRLRFNLLEFPHPSRHYGELKELRTNNIALGEGICEIVSSRKYIWDAELQADTAITIHNVFGTQLLELKKDRGNNSEGLHRCDKRQYILQPLNYEQLGKPDIGIVGKGIKFSLGTEYKGDKPNYYFEFLSTIIQYSRDEKNIGHLTIRTNPNNPIPTNIEWSSLIYTLRYVFKFNVFNQGLRGGEETELFCMTLNDQDIERINKLLTTDKTETDVVIKGRNLLTALKLDAAYSIHLNEYPTVTVNGHQLLPEQCDGCIYVHNESGVKYILITVTNQTATKNGYVEQAVYMSTKTKEIFSRPYSEFATKFTLFKPKQD